jgi:hypothetical protein
MLDRARSGIEHQAAVEEHVRRHRRHEQDRAVPWRHHRVHEPRASTRSIRSASATIMTVGRVRRERRAVDATGAAGRCVLVRCFSSTASFNARHRRAGLGRRPASIAPTSTDQHHRRDAIERRRVAWAKNFSECHDHLTTASTSARYPEQSDVDADASGPRRTVEQLHRAQHRAVAAEADARGRLRPPGERSEASSASPSAAASSGTASSTSWPLVRQPLPPR